MKNTKELNQEQKGITLIALVITVIVLLILAGVSIAMLTGNNGILTQAKLAKEKTELTKEDEENKLERNNEYINKQTGNAVPGKIVIETKKDNYVDSEGNKVTIPAGFTVSKIPGEEKVANGLVIYDIPESDIENIDWTMKNEDGVYNVQTLYNQFVWIPVASEDAYQMDFSYPSGYYRNIENTFTDTEYLPTDIQPTIDDATNNEKAERTAVLKYNGFYISRYETGIENSKPVSKQNATVYTDKKQTEFKRIGKDMYGDSSNYVKSAMCSGIQWDMVMKFIDGKTDGKENTYDVRTYNPARHTGSKAETGKNLSDKVQNIYDLEGNCYEYVAEKSNSNTSLPFVHCGGYYDDDSYFRASMRNCDYDIALSYVTFRSVLYIKQN